MELDYELRESAGNAWLVAFTALSPTQRAALVLRVALGFSAAETAELLGTSTASVNSALQRARRAVDTAPGDPAASSPGELADLVERCAVAMEAGDVHTLVSLVSA